MGTPVSTRRPSARARSVGGSRPVFGGKGSITGCASVGTFRSDNRSGTAAWLSVLLSRAPPLIGVVTERAGGLGPAHQAARSVVLRGRPDKKGTIWAISGRGFF